MAVQLLQFTNCISLDSALDKSAQHGGTEDVSRALTHNCPLCDARFASQKALRMHERAKHGERAIFNSGYAVALDMLHWRLAQQGISLRLKLHKAGAFWGGCSDEDADQKDIIDATFVDGECIVILGTTPRVLVRAIDSLLEITTTVFRVLHLEINFSKGQNGSSSALPG